MLEQLLVHPLGGPAQGQLAQSGQVDGGEVVLERPLGLLGNVDLALFEPLDQIVGRQVDELDGVRPIEDGIRHRLAHAHARDLRDHVVQALDVLDIDGRVDVDAGIQQLFDIEVAFGVPAARNVGMGKLVDEDEAGVPLERGIDVELVQDAIDVDRRLAGKNLEAFQQRLGLLAPVRLDDADNDVHAFLQLGAGGLQHLVGLADARRRADEDLEPTDATFLLSSGLGKQGFRRGSLLRFAPLICHRSKARHSRLHAPGPGLPRAARSSAKVEIAVLTARR